MRTLFAAVTCVFALASFAHAEEPVNSDAALVYQGVAQDEESGGNAIAALNQLTQTTVNQFHASFGKVGELLKKELERASVHFCANFLKLTGGKSQQLSAAYCYGVQPAAYRNHNFFQRMDKYLVDASTGDLLRVTHAASGAGMEVGAQGAIEFVRQFDDVFKAYAAIPYLPTRLPLNADGIKKLAVNDYATFYTDMNILWDVSPALKRGVWELGASLYYLVSGTFQVNLFKLDPSHIKMKVVALHGNEVGANVSFGITKELKIFGIHVVDKQVNRIFDATNLLYAGTSKSKDATFVAEYNIDLNDPAAATAYNLVMKTSWRTQTIKATQELAAALKAIPSMLKWFTKGNKSENFAADLGNSYLNVVTPLDEIFKQDQQMGPAGGNPRVARKFQGIVTSDSVTSGYQIGLSRFIFSVVGSQAFYENSIELEDASSNKQYYLFDVTKDIFAKNIMFTLRDDKETSDVHALYKTDANHTIKTFDGLGLTYEYRDKTMSSKKQKEIYTKLQKLLPAQAFAMLNFTGWDMNSTKSNARIYQQIIFRSNALESISKQYRNPMQIKAALMKLLEAEEKQGTLPKVRIKNSMNNYGNLASDYEIDAEEIGIRLSKALSDLEKGEDRRRAVTVLSSELPIFKEVWVPLLVGMLPPQDVNQLVYIDVSWTADGSFAGLPKPYGTIPTGAIYDSMRYVLSLLNKANFDLNTYLGENDLAKIGN